MKYSPDLLKAVDHCQYRSFITNRYNGARIAVDCGQCDYCIHKKAQKASMRVKTAGSAFKYSYFVTLTYDNEEQYAFRSAPLRGFLQHHRISLSSGVRCGRGLGR
jgi:hypothetical protein